MKTSSHRCLETILVMLVFAALPCAQSLANVSNYNYGSFSGTCPYNLSITGPAEVGTPIIHNNQPTCYCEKDKGAQAACTNNRYTHYSFNCESPNSQTGACSCAGGEPVISSYTIFGIPTLDGYKSATFVCQ